MVKRLTKTGDRWSLVLDPPFLEAAKIDPEAPLEVSTDGEVIVISPVRDGSRTERFKAGVEAINRRYAGVFRRLAE